MRMLMQRLSRRVDNLVARGIVWMADSSKIQRVQISLQKGEVRFAEHFQPYGFHSVPLPRAQAVVLFVGGIRDHALCVSVDDPRYRPIDWAAGEVGLKTHEGDFIRMRNGRVIEVMCGTRLDVTAPEAVIHASGKVTLDTPLVEMTGNLTVSGTVQGNAVRTAAGIQLGTHMHSGVQAGGANTGGPV